MEAKLHIFLTSTRDGVMGQMQSKGNNKTVSIDGWLGRPHNRSGGFGEGKCKENNFPVH